MSSPLLRSVRVGLSALLALTCVSTLYGPFTGYLKIPDIPGESRAADHEDEIDITGFSWVIETEPGTTRTSSRAEIGDLKVIKRLDKSSPYLALACAKGTALREVVLVARRDSGDTHLDYLTITMTNVRVSGYQSSSTAGGDGHPTETISLNFERIRFKYVQQNDDHSAGDEHEIEYDIAAGV